MAAANHQLFVFDNGRKIKDSKALEVLVAAIAVSADGGVTNTLTIKEGTGGAANTFDFGGKVLGNIASGTAAGQALSYSQRGAANGVASLDVGGKVPAAELPNSIMEYVGTFNPSTHVPNLQNGGAAIASLKIIQDITYTAKAAGVAGDAITITYVSDVTQGNETAAAVGNVFTVHIETGVSTATQVKAAVDAANVLVDAVITGTAGTGQTTQGPTNLAGGADAVNSGAVYKATAGGAHNFGAGALTFVTGDYAIYNASGVWELAHSGADAVVSVDGQAGVVSLSAVYAAIGHNHTGVYEPAGAAAAIVAASITDNDTTHAPSGEAVYEALLLKANAADVGSSQYASFTNKEVGAITVRQFVKMLVVGQVTLLTSTDSVNDETFFGVVKDATIAADAPGNIYLPEVGARLGGYSALDVTKLVYAHGSTPGSYTQTRPVAGKVIILGKPVSASEIIFLGRFEVEYV
jgi:hypothetical protein